MIEVNTQREKDDSEDESGLLRIDHRFFTYEEWADILGITVEELIIQGVIDT